MFFVWFFAILFSVLFILFLLTFLCYFITFYSGKRNAIDPDNLHLPKGANYDNYKEQISTWIKETRKLPFEVFSVKSFDNLTLKGKFYKFCDGAPIEIIFHGYRGNSERDLSGAVERCFMLNRSVLIVDQRASGESEGKTITFGINEKKDCLAWIDFVIKNFGQSVQIILGGISMGASTVLMASAENLPENVKYIISDCGYSSPKEIIKKVIREMKLPSNILYPFIKLSAKIFGNFNLEESSPIDAVKKANVPIIFIHGNKDGFVPHYMSEKLYELCSTQKSLKIISGAEHGLAYPVCKGEYVNAIKEFEENLR